MRKRSLDSRAARYLSACVVALLWSGCPWLSLGFPDGGNPCSEKAQCATGQECLPPEVDGPVCGIPCQVRNDCQDDGGCTLGRVCNAYLGGCCDWSAKRSFTCVAPCTPDGGQCQGNERCAPDGRCEPLACDAGYACRTNFTCAPSAWRADDNGCIRTPCAKDTDCPGGSRCVNGQCFASRGTCGVAVPVP